MELDEHVSVLDAPDCETLLARMLQFGERMGFGRVSTLSVIDHSDGSCSFFPLNNVPASMYWFASDPEFGRSDPVVQHCKRSSLPIWWNRATYVQTPYAESWEVLAYYGYSSGLCFAMHLPQGRHFMLSLSNDEIELPDEARRWRMAADAHLFAAFLQQAAFRLLQPREPSMDFRLGPLELEALRWTMAGKTAWEVGQILSKSERSVAGYLGSAARKLGCVNKYQAVAKAIKLGLVK